jgi:putative peptidoglycan lipid II flippase
MNLLRSVATVSGWTLLSRVTGLIRENLTATVFGASALTDGFFVAFRLPNLLRRLFAEGAFSQAFVPILAATRVRHDAAQTRQLINHVSTVLFWILVLISALAIVLAPVLVLAMASGIYKQPEVFNATVSMTRWMFPYIVLISLTALAASILNTWRQFAIPAFTPVLLNLGFIGATLYLSPWFDPPIYALTVGVMLGGVAQLAIQIPALRRIGMLPRIGFKFRAAFADPEVRRIVRNMGPAVLAVSAAQISLIINTHIASRVGAGAVSWISFGDRLMEFPTALLGVALGTVLLPSLVQAHSQGRHDEYSALLDWGLRLCALLALPCMVGLGIMAQPLTALLFHYGQFDAHDLRMTSQAVSAYSFGLIGLIAIKILAPGFYAKQDVRTPVRISLLILAFTQLLNLALVPWLGHAGLALSISIAALANATLLFYGLRRRGLYRPKMPWRSFLFKLFVALSAMALFLGMATTHFDWVAEQARPWRRVAMTLTIVGTGAAVYFASLWLMGLRTHEFMRRTPPR